MVAELQMTDGTWVSFLCERPPDKLLDQIMKKRLEFYEAAKRLEPEAIIDLIPITFPIMNVLDRDLFHGVGRFDVDKALKESHPYFSMVSWIVMCQKIAKGDMVNLGSFLAFVNN